MALLVLLPALCFHRKDVSGYKELHFKVAEFTGLAPF